MSRSLHRRMQYVLFDVTKHERLTPALRRRARLVLLELILSAER